MNVIKKMFLSSMVARLHRVSKKYQHKVSISFSPDGPNFKFQKKKIQKPVQLFFVHCKKNLSFRLSDEKSH